MTVSLMKTTFQKLKLFMTEIFNEDFRRYLLQNLSLENINTNSNGFEKFSKIASIHLIKWHQKRNIYVEIICHF